MKKQFIYILLSFLFIGNLSAQQTPAPKQAKKIAIVGATAHIGDGNVIENSLIEFSNGKITFIGKASDKTPEGEVMNYNGKHIYPGFIAANTSLGLGGCTSRASDRPNEPAFC